MALPWLRVIVRGGVVVNALVSGGTIATVINWLRKYAADTETESKAQDSTVTFDSLTAE